MLGAIAFQLKRGARGGVPIEAQAVAATLYGLFAVGVTRIGRPGNDRFPDQFLEHLSERRLYLA